MKEIKIETSIIIELLESLEKEFKEDLSFFKSFVTENKLEYEINDHRINFYGYYEINDYFRRHLEFEVPKLIHKGYVDYLLYDQKEENVIFYEHRNKELFKINKKINYFNLTEIDLRTFSNFCY